MNNIGLSAIDVGDAAANMIERIEQLTFKTRSTRNQAEFIAKSTVELEAVVNVSNLDVHVAFLIADVLFKMCDLTRIVNAQLIGCLGQAAAVNFHLDSVIKLLPKDVPPQRKISASALRIKRLCKEMKNTTDLLQEACKLQEEIIIALAR